VRREDDRVTRWLKKNWRDPNWESATFVRAMLLARMVNWPPTLELIGYPKRWDSQKIIATIEQAAEVGKAWGAAYVITTCGKQMSKPLYVVENVCRAVPLGWPLHTGPNTLEALSNSLRAIDGLGAGFLAAQVVADLKNTPLLANAKDWWTWAIPGPGSRRGLAKYFNSIVTPNDHQWQEGLKIVIAETQPLVTKEIGMVHAQDWQNCLCEYDKWRRVKDGEGRPKSKYSPEGAYQA